VHATLARWLDDDHHADRKPWSWVARRNGIDDMIEIGLLDDNLADRLVAGADAYLRSPSQRRIPVAGSIHQVAVRTWTQLASLPGRPPWTMDFVSPVAFRRANRFLPWPAPSSVFGSLRTSWRTFGASHVGDLTVDLRADPLVVTAVEGCSRCDRVVLRHGDQPGRSPIQVDVSGFVGRVRYTVDGEIDCSAVSALVALAPFAGVGAYTTRGFGAVRLVARG
jgi:CRISPR-associated endoribonuclease Cas6